MLLCTKHHALVHEGGFTIQKDYKDRWFFRRPDGRAVPVCGYRPEDVTDDDVETADAFFGERASAEASHPAAEAFTVNEPSAEAWMVREPRAESYWFARKFARHAQRRHVQTEQGMIDLLVCRRREVLPAVTGFA